LDDEKSKVSGFKASSLKKEWAVAVYSGQELI
jgi:hypothetical protein